MIEPPVGSIVTVTSGGDQLRKVAAQRWPDGWIMATVSGRYYAWSTFSDPELVYEAPAPIPDEPDHEHILIDKTGMVWGWEPHEDKWVSSDDEGDRPAVYKRYKPFMITALLETVV